MNAFHLPLFHFAPLCYLPSPRFSTYFYNTQSTIGSLKLKISAIY